MSFKIATDTSANIPAQTVKKNNITVIPFSFYIDGKENTCEDAEKFDASHFYGLMRAHKKVTTSQITPQRYIEYFEPILENGDDILFVGMSSGVSGAYNSATIAASELTEKYPERKIMTVDTLGASLGEGLIVLRACEYRDLGKSITETAALLDDSIKSMYQVFTVDDLEYLRRGGRLSNAVAFVGNLLGIRPLLKGNEHGKIVSFGKARGRRKIIDLIVSKYSELAVSPEEQTVGISHADCKEDAELLAQLISEKAKPKSIITVEHEPATGSYLGPGALALYFFGNTDVRNK